MAHWIQNASIPQRQFRRFSPKSGEFFTDVRHTGFICNLITLVHFQQKFAPQVLA